MVTRKDITEALYRLGIKNGDILLFHSSLKSLGGVEGGADAVIDGMLDALLPDGTLVAPTLVQKDFANAYKNWDIKKTPSDVGYLTEVLRLRPNAYRSDQATHSVAAIGKGAEALTVGHTAYGPRHHVYGRYAFGESSPWQKMYDRGAKLLFLGVTPRCATFHHYVEAKMMQSRLDAISEGEEKAALSSRLVPFENIAEFTRQHTERRLNGTPMTLLAPMITGDKVLLMQEIFRERGLEKSTTCGNATLLLYDVREFVDAMESLASEEPERWFPPEEAAWFRDADALCKK